MEERICRECGGKGYVSDSDYLSLQTFYRDCEVCDSHGKIPVAKEEGTEWPT